MRYPLVDGQGNFGSIDGDPPAAYRYTEARLESLAEAMMADLDKETVDFVPNFDETTEEPTVLPAPYPNLLVNGSAGHRGRHGDEHSAAQHARGHRRRHRGRSSSARSRSHATSASARCCSCIPGPGLPDRRLIVGRAGHLPRLSRPAAASSPSARRASSSRRSEEGRPTSRSSSPRSRIRSTRRALIAKIAELVRDKTIEGISDLRDESDRDGMRIVIELKRGELPDVVLNNLYKHTQLQTSFGIIMLAIVGGRPRVLTLLEIIEHFIEFRREVVRRRTEFELRKAEARAHILEGLKIALDHLDAVIALIRGSKNPAEARDGLMTQFGLSQIQSQAILDMQLQRLTGLERQKILDELAELMKTIERLRAILSTTSC